MKKKAFTLIELIAVLVIFAILALIVTPLVMNIIKKVRISADKRSVDAYGRSIELAVGKYLLDESKFPNSVDELNYEYKGDEVVCLTTQINPDGTVYLKDCKVKNRNVDDYTYGRDKMPKLYKAGEIVEYNGNEYYVLKDENINDTTITLLKATPLTEQEVNLYGVGHINNYTSYSSKTTKNINNYGGVAFYSSETCGYISVYDDYDTTGCKNDYESSDVKYIVDAWSRDKVGDKLVQARLIMIDEIETELKEFDCCGGCGTCKYTSRVFKYSWLSGNGYSYWTMNNEPSSFSTNNNYLNYRIDTILGNVYTSSVYYPDYVIRPVIILLKSAIKEI